MEKLKTAVAADEETYDIDGKSSKNQRAEKKEFRRKLLEYVMEKLPGLQTRTRRAGLVHNFLRGLGLNTPQGILGYECNSRCFVMSFARQPITALQLAEILSQYTCHYSFITFDSTYPCQPFKQPMPGQ